MAGHEPDSDEVVELTPDEVEFIDRWRAYWGRRTPMNLAEMELLNDVARAALGEEFVRHNTISVDVSAKGFLARRRMLPAYDELSCGDIERNLPAGVLGGMVGDALGAPIEFHAINQVREAFGSRGLLGMAPVFGRLGAVTDDTQTALFVLEGLIMARVRWRREKSKPSFHPRSELQMALMHWLHAQGIAWDRVLPPPAKKSKEPFGVLASVPEMHQQRSPNRTNMEALGAFALATGDHPELGISNFQSPLNDAQDCGGLSRAAMVAVWTDVPERAFSLGATVSLITHGNPSGYLPGGVLAVLAQYLLHGQSWDDALDAALYQLSRWKGHEATTSYLRTAAELGRRGEVGPESLDQHFGGSPSAPAVLATAVAAAMSNPDSFPAAVLAAVNHSGNSATAGFVCGALMGLKLGLPAIPEQWLQVLELKEPAEELLRNVTSEFCAREAPDSEEWINRYTVRI